MKKIIRIGKDMFVLEISRDITMDYCRNALLHGGEKDMINAVHCLGDWATKGNNEAKEMIEYLAKKGNKKIKPLASSFVSMI